MLALVLRLAFVLLIDPHPDFGGGDTNWYMQNGRDLVTTGTTAGPLQTPPLYLLFVGTVQALLPGTPPDGEFFTFAEMQTVRVIQSVLGAALCVLAAAITARLFTPRAGQVAGVILAISPALVIEAGILLTEQVFLFLLFAGLWFYVRHRPSPSRGDLALSGLILGLAALTRASLLAFPAVLAIHLLLTRRRDWWRAAAALLIPFALIVSTWTVYNLLEWDRFVVGGEGLLSFLYMGAEGEDGPQDMDWVLMTPDENSHEVRQERMRDRLQASLTRDPFGWVLHRGHELVEAFAQPHNTVYWGGESIRDAAWRWLRDDRTPGGLRDVIGIEAFWPKLALYVFHYAGLLAGAWGMLRARRRWRQLWPLYGVIGYYVLLHIPLLAIPRYVFPIYPALWMFGAAWISGALRPQPDAAFPGPSGVTSPAAS